MGISVAVPDSALGDESTKADKTRKAAFMARACAIFGVECVYIYGDRAPREDASLLASVLRYAETPQYLRRRLFPRVNELKYAGVIYPLQIPSHTVTSNAGRVKAGDVRDGVVTLSRGSKYVDVGLGRLVSYHGQARSGARITVQFKSGPPELGIKEIRRSEAGAYWGYETRQRAGLAELLRSWKGRIVLTSRRGRPLSGAKTRAWQNGPLLVAFGSTERGIPEMLGGSAKRVQNAATVNFFPEQRTGTVRLEEALLGVLSILAAAGHGVGR